MRSPLSPAALVASGGTRATAGISLNNAHLDEMPFYELAQRVHDRDLTFTLSDGFETWESPEVVRSVLTESGGTLVVSHGSEVFGIEGTDWFVAFSGMYGHWYAAVGAKTEAQCASILDALEELAGQPDPLEADEITMMVWSEHPMGGGLARYASMKVGLWSLVAGNYPASVRDQLERLAAKLPERSEGGIVLLCGIAGSGKSRCIEALAAQWAKDARLGVVVDPDRFLGSASYLADVLTTCGREKRQVIVVEDVDEMIKAGPKSDATAKLLNIADGIVGRLAGAGTLVVLTANLAREDIAAHIARPGRAAAVIEFEAFGAEEANAWLADRDSDVVLDENEDGYVLADLYSALRGE